MEEIYIYVLKHPITNEIRYVGKARNIKQRFYNHLNTSINGKRHIQRWIKSLTIINLIPIIEQIEITNNTLWKEREIYWINYYNNLGYNLCNHSKGGEGAGLNNQNRIGKKHSFETINKFKNRIYTLEIKNKIKEKAKLRKLSKNNNSKKCIDLLTNKEYNSLKEACLILNLKYTSQVNYIFNKSKKIRFKYKDN